MKSDSADDWYNLIYSRPKEENIKSRESSSETDKNALADGVWLRTPPRGGRGYDLWFLRNGGLYTQITGHVFLILSAKTCPDTMIYKESSSPCMDTCSHMDISNLCEEHYMDGCFCPEGKCYSSYCIWNKTKSSDKGDQSWNIKCSSFIS